jgi:methionine synthase II (cobalamin-independent)
LSHKAVHNWFEKRDIPLADDEEVVAEVRKWLRQESKDFYAAGFDALVKQWDRCIEK